MLHISLLVINRISLNRNFYFLWRFLASKGSSTIQDKSGKCLTEEQEILSRWIEYRSELYNHESCGDNAVLDSYQPPKEDCNRSSVMKLRLQ